MTWLLFFRKCDQPVIENTWFNPLGVRECKRKKKVSKQFQIVYRPKVISRWKVQIWADGGTRGFDSRYCLGTWPLKKKIFPTCSLNTQRWLFKASIISCFSFFHLLNSLFLSSLFNLILQEFMWAESNQTSWNINWIHDMIVIV